MKILKKIIFVVIILFVFTSSLSMANEQSSEFRAIEYTDEFKEWLNLSDKENTLMPRPFEILNTNRVTNNPIKFSQMLGNSAIPKFDLRDIIKDNLIIKNQGQTMACWSFASVASFETCLALKNYHNNTPTVKYDFSEEHLLYATTRTLGNSINKYGVNKKVSDGGNYMISSSYYTSQLGPIDDKEMPYDSSFETKTTSEVLSKTPSARIYDFAYLPSSNDANTSISEIQEAIKNHVKNYGGVETGIFGAQVESEFYNNSTGALYCDDAENNKYNHEVLIIGWDDNYSKENFNEAHRPKNDGAWIIKNSWGTRLVEYTFDEVKEIIFNNTDPATLAEYNIRTKDDISDTIVERHLRDKGFEVENGVGYIKLADDGFMYLSYEDANVYKLLGGVQDASDKVDYNYVYQYDYCPSGASGIVFTKQEAYIGNIFEKQSDETEYLNEVAFTGNETVECKVYVNPNGKSMAPSDLQEVQLKAGSSQTVEPGYHTLKFSNPVKINSNEFAVVIYIKGNRQNELDILLEAPIKDVETFKDIELESDKCFVTLKDGFQNNVWYDCSKLYQISNGTIDNGDNTIKAFTTTSKNSNDEGDPDEPEEPTSDGAIPMETNDATVRVLSAKVFYFTDKSKKEYTTIKVSVDNIERSLYNDTSTYYYYVSTNSNVDNPNWVKILEKQNSKNVIQFTIDTKDLDNYDELVKGNDVYLFIKEVAVKGNSTKTTFSKGLKFKNDTTLAEVYKDNVKQDKNKVEDDVRGQNDPKESSQTSNTTVENNVKVVDTTTSTKKLPNTGGPIIIIITAIAFSVFSVIIYNKYKNIDT